MDSEDSRKLDYVYNAFQQQGIAPCYFTVSQWCDKWLSFKVKKLSDGSLDKYKRTIKHIKHMFGDMLIAQFDILKAQQLFNSITAVSVKDDCYSLLKEMFNKAAKMRLIAFNPIDCIEITKHVKQPKSAFTRDEEKDFLMACVDNKQYMLILGLACGLRRGEMLGLYATDIDLKHKIVHVRRQCLNGKMCPPKTKTSVRDVPIFDCYFNLIDWNSFLKNNRLCPIKENAIRDRFNKMKSASGITNPDITMHSIRHTFCTRCAERGIAIHVTQHWLGHSTPDMTIRVYTHVNDDFAISEVEKYNKGVEVEENNQFQVL